MFSTDTRVQNAVKEVHSVPVDQSVASFVKQLPQLFSHLFTRPIGDFKPDQVDYIPFVSKPKMQFYKQRLMVGKAHEFVMDNIKEWLELQVIKQVCYTPLVVLPIVLVSKPRSEKLRLCFDFRLLNASVEQIYAPTIDRHKLVHSLQRKQFLSKIDIANAFMSVRVHDTIQDYFGFEYDSHFYVMTRLKEGYHNSMFFYLRAINSSLAKIKSLLPKGVVLYCYVDDIALGSDDKQSHKQALMIMCKVLQEDGWALRLDKCAWFQDCILFLGLQISTNNISLDKQTLDRLNDLPVPKCHQDLRGFFGLCVGLNAFFFNLESLIAPLRAFRGKAALVFSSENFLQVWHSVMHQVTRSWWSIDYFDSQSTESLSVFLDSSRHGHGGALLQGDRLIQLFSTGNLKPWASSAHAELSGYCRVLKAFSSFLFHRPFTVYTDNRAVLAIQSPQNHSDFLMRRLDELHALRLFPSSILHLEGSRNLLADTLSRYRYFHAQRKNVLSLSHGVSFVSPTLTDAQWDEVHKGHASLRNMLHLCEEWGYDVTKEHLETRLKTCKACQAFKKNTNRSPFYGIMHVTKPGELIVVDFLGPLPLSHGFRYVLVMVDYLTRFNKMILCPNTTAKVVVEGLQSWLDELGPVSAILFDNDTSFRNKTISSWAHNLRIRTIFIPPYRHSSLGVAERMIQTLLGRLRRFLYQKNSADWSFYVEKSSDIINKWKHSMLNMSPDLAWGAGDIVWESLAHKAQQQRAYWNAKQNRCDKHAAITPRMRVWVYNLPRLEAKGGVKFAPLWLGPSEVEKRESEHIWVVRLPEGKRTRVHIDAIRIYE